MAGNKDNSSPQEDFNTQNIFDEFTESQDIGDEVKKVEALAEKDVYYYLKKLSRFFLVCNTLLFLGVIFSVIYVYIQDSEDKREYSLLSPICSLFLWKWEIWGGSCYGVAWVLQEYREKVDSESSIQAEKILPLLWEVYALENFNFSKRASFLLQKTEERLMTIEILSAFDELKTKFAPRDKSEISCYNVSISSVNNMLVSCDIYSSDWDSSIANLEDGSISSNSWWGTSISRASSFIDFLENYSESPFNILDKPWILTVENVQNWPYTRKTTIQLQLQYSRLSDLPL